ncbi:MAG: hypothetical protein TUN42_02915 [Dehalogenimonas sp.]
MALYKPGLFGFTDSVDQKALSVFTGVLAFATLFLASGTFQSLIDSEKKEKDSLRERRRIEILNWSIEVNTFSLQHRTEAVEDMLKNTSRLYLEEQLKALFYQFEPSRSKSVYMAEIAAGLDGDIKSDVDELINRIKSQIELLHDYRKTRSTLALDSAAADLAAKVAANNGMIHSQAVKVIKQIAKGNLNDL